MTYVHWHWHCDCGAWGNATSRDATLWMIERHRAKGHVIEGWKRGERHLATTGGLPDED